MKRKRVTQAFLVYQGGLANVFKVECYNLSPFGREAERLFQGSFREAIFFARGLAAAGVGIKTAACNKAGDIREETWTEDFDNMPFSEEFVVLNENNRGETLADEGGF